MMREKWRRAFLMWSGRDEYRKLVENTLKLIEYTAERYVCVVSYSGGKDSTAMLHLCLQIDPDMYVYHWDHGSWLMPREIEEEIIENARKIGAKNLIVNSSPLLEKPEIREKWSIWYPVFWSELDRLRRKYGWEKNFVGLRKEEGCRRRAKIAAHEREWEVYPLAEWSWMDVWAYIVENNLPYPSIYDRYADLLGYRYTRLVTFFDREFEKYGSPYLDGFLMPEKRYRKK